MDYDGTWSLWIPKSPCELQVNIVVNIMDSRATLKLDMESIQAFSIDYDGT